MFYWLKTITLAVIDLVKQVFEWTVFSYMSNWFVTLSKFIGWPATIFVATLLFIVFVRIWIAFIFKICRLNLDYKKYRKL